MAESFIPQTLELGVRRPVGGALGSARLALGSRAAASTSIRTGPSPAVATALLHKALAAVDMRLVGSLSRAGGSGAQVAVDAVEMALLARYDRSLRSHLQSLAEDVVLCDSLAEFADAVHATLADLEADEARRSGRLLAFVRELLGEVAAHRSSKAAALKQKYSRARALLEQARRVGQAQQQRHMAQALQFVSSLYQELHGELNRLLPRPQRSALDALLEAGR